MYKKIGFATCVYLVTFGLFAQNNALKPLLQQIEQNNPVLKAYTHLNTSNKLHLKTTNNLSDPQIGAYFLPWGTHDDGDYTEIEITQSFEFPTVYSSRKNLIKKQQKNADLSQSIVRQNILLKAQKQGLLYLSLRQKVLLEKERLQQASKIVKQIQELFKQEQVGILALNKAKIAWIQAQFTIEKLQTEQETSLKLLENLNGNIPLDLKNLLVENTTEILPFEKLWSDRTVADPNLLQLKQQALIANQAFRVSKNQSLPNISVGYSYQGVSGANYSGVYAGLSIPIWKNKYKVKAAKANYTFKQQQAIAALNEAKVMYEQVYNNYMISQHNYTKYQQVLDTLNSEPLLFKAYELGEISFMDYYVEVQYYRDAIDTKNELKKEVQLLMADLLQHQL
ncbi:MAG: TolC family protein [Flavobacteriaceae bacterium]|nr:TolC family protein [Flavobacteriaceae bacterium]